MTHGSNDPVQAGLTIDVWAQGTVSVVAVSGEIDAASVGSLHTRVEGLAASGHANQVLDLAGVSFLDSSGLGALVALRRRLESEGGALVVACDNEIVLRLLRLTKLDSVITVYPTVTEALGNGFVG